jgi:hypothetical protein
MTIRGGGNPHSAMAAMPLREWTRRLGALPAEAYDCFMVGTPYGVQPNTSVVRAIDRGQWQAPLGSSSRPTARSPAACRRARVRQGQAFGGAEEAPSLTAAARDGDENMRVGRKNACSAGRTKEWNDNGRQKWCEVALTKKAPYKPDALIGHVRFDERGWETERCQLAQATAPILDSTIAALRAISHVGARADMPQCRKWSE